MPNAGDKIPYGEGPFPDPSEPCMHAVNFFHGNTEFLPESADEPEAEASSELVTDADTARAAKKRRYHRQDEVEFPPRRKVPAERKEGFIGNGQAHNAEHQ